MNRYLKQVGEFHTTFSHPLNYEVIDDANLRKLRISLLFEELKELSQTSKETFTHFQELCSNLEDTEVAEQYDEKEALDALCDIQYVLSGAVLSMGFTRKFDHAFEEVHRSNMTKACETEQQGLDTIEYHKGRGETMEMEVVKSGDLFIVVREDGKIMKSKYYSPANLDKFS